MPPLEEGRIGSSAHFSCFMVDRRLLNEIGDFDELFNPIYHEDSDMIWRVHLKNQVTCRNKSSVFYHVEAGTLKSYVDSKLDAEAQKYYQIVQLNLARYKLKWGGVPREEKFTVPFNGDKPEALLKELEDAQQKIASGELDISEL